MVFNRGKEGEQRGGRNYEEGKRVEDITMNYLLEHWQAAGRGFLIGM